MSSSASSGSPASFPPVQRGAFVCIVFALMCFGALDTSTKLAAAAAVPVLMVVWMRYVVQTLVTAAMLLPRQGARLLHTRRPGLQVLRSLLLIGSNTTAFLSLKHMHVGEFTAIVMLTPLLLTMVAAWALRERVSGLRWLCLLAGFGGTLLVMRPGGDMFHLATLFPLLLVLISAAFQLITSTLAKVDAPGTIHFYSGLGGLLATSIALPLAWQPQSLAIWLLMVLMGVFGAVGHFLLILAYGRAPVAVLTPYLYLQIIFAVLGSALVFAHFPDALACAGIALIAAGGVTGTWLNGREMLARSRQQEAAQSSIAAVAGADGR